MEPTYLVVLVALFLFVGFFALGYVILSSVILKRSRDQDLDNLLIGPTKGQDQEPEAMRVALETEIQDLTRQAALLREQLDHVDALRQFLTKDHLLQRMQG